MYPNAPFDPNQAPAPQPAPSPSPFGGQPQPAPIAPTPPPMPHRRANKWLIIGVSAIAVAVISLGVLTWALINYFDQKNNTDSKVSAAVTKAVKDQADTDAANFEAEEKKPNRQFVSPEDLGAVSFDYPKTWSVYVDKDGSSNTAYEAYFHPVTVPPVSATTQFALRVTIQTRDYDTVLGTFDSLVKKGDLKSSTVKVNGQNATRLDGAFSKDIRGAAIFFKQRDKTVMIRTDADTFKADFDALIATVTFNL